MRRQKQASQQQSIVHLFQPLTLSERREVRLGQRMAATVSRDMCQSGGGGVGGYWSHCGHLWHLSGGLSVIRQGKWGQSGVVLCAYVWWSRQTTTARQTGSQRVHPVSTVVQHNQLVFVSVSFFNAALPLCPVSTLNTVYLYERIALAQEELTRSVVF